MRLHVKPSQDQFAPLMTDVLPFEVPVCFSNRGFFEYLTRTGAQLDGRELVLADDSVEEATLVRMLFGKDVISQVGSGDLRIDLTGMRTTPLRYKVSKDRHEERHLAIPHPLAQVGVAAFYKDYAYTLIETSRRPSFSVRRPIARATTFIVRDSVFASRQDRDKHAVEESAREYEVLGSYFGYDGFRVIQRLYESPLFSDLQRKFPRLLTVDIQRCFDSIYTHSIAWATHTRPAVKDYQNAHRRTMSGVFDDLMQGMNDRETHGILIGPEFSRIFAEILLQNVDREVVHRLAAIDSPSPLTQGKDYEVVRYIDDYFIFAKDSAVAARVERALTHELDAFRWHLNASKRDEAETPIISDIEVARNAVRRAAKEAVAGRIVKGDAGGTLLEIVLVPRELRRDYVDALSRVRASPVPVASFAISELERRLSDVAEVVVRFAEENPSGAREALLAQSRRLADVCRLLFELYEHAPRVSNAVKVVRAVTQVRKLVRAVTAQLAESQWLDDVLAEECLLQLERNPLRAEYSVESLFFVDLLAETLGPGVSASRVTSLLGLTSSTAPVVPVWFNSLTLCTIIRFCLEREGYELVLKSLINDAIERIEAGAKARSYGADTAILAMGVLTLPVATVQQKRTVVKAFYKRATNAQVATIASRSDVWFFDWGKIDLHDKLLVKAVRAVY